MEAGALSNRTMEIGPVFSPNTFQAHWNDLTCIAILRLCFCSKQNQSVPLLEFQSKHPNIGELGVVISYC